ncbi:glycosyl hydrolases family 31-domain-containing protein [Spinellus fusiger]|nr:glycosyl hydrolases family 31-domain-containing protein [Spinellus fusiger]
MLHSVLNHMGLDVEEILKPHLFMGSIADKEYTVGQFRIHIDCQAQAVVVKNSQNRCVWKSLPNTPFLSSTSGKDIIESTAKGWTFKENDTHPTHLQTIQRVESTPDQLTLYGGLSTKLVQPTHMDYSFTFKAMSPHQLQWTAQFIRKDPSMMDHCHLFVTFESRKEEEIYGFGQQQYAMTFKGQKVPVFVGEQNIKHESTTTSRFHPSLSTLASLADHSQDHFTTCASVPHFMTTDNRCLFLETSNYASFDFRKPDRITLRSDTDTVVGRIVEEESMLAILSEYTYYCGRMALLPEWVSEGAIAGIEGGASKVRQIITRLKDHATPLAAVWIRDWTGVHEKPPGSAVQSVWSHWESDPVLYPQWKELVEELQHTEAPVRVMAAMRPLLSNSRDKQGGHRLLFTEAQNKGFLVKDLLRPSECKTWLVPQVTEVETGMLDLTHPDARGWMKQVWKEQVWDTGIAGLMLEGGESLPYSSERIAIEVGRPEAYHNTYAEDWARLHYETVKELEIEKDVVLSCHSAYTCSPGAMHVKWTGPQTVTWDYHGGIKSAVVAMLSGGFSGFSVTHSDIGGSNPVDGVLPGKHVKRPRELLYRWMELAAFTAMFRTHQGIIPEGNAQFYDTEDTYSHFSHTAKLFQSLSPYRRHLIEEAHEKGWPCMRAMVLYYPQDSTVRQISYQQFFLGSCLLVAPTLSPSASYVKVYFPVDATPGLVWRHLWTGKHYAADGGYVPIDTPLGLPAVFVREPRLDDGRLDSLFAYADSYLRHKGTL